MCDEGGEAYGEEVEPCGWGDGARLVGEEDVGDYGLGVG